MAGKVQKPCKICGKMFTPCADCENDKTMFRWKRVACSPECAKEYFAKVEASRSTYIRKEEKQVAGTGHMETVDVSLGENEAADMDKKSRKTRKKNIENEESEQID